MRLSFLLLLPAASLLAGGGSLTHDQALAQAFPKQEVEREAHYWTKAEVEAICKQSGAKTIAPSRSSWHAKRKPEAAVNGGSQGHEAWFDQRLVRSKAQDLMVVIDAQGKVVEVVVCRFDEPQDYRPSEKWYQQFVGQSLDENLALGKDIHAVSGATLTARATTAAVREALAADDIARHGVPKPEPEPQPTPAPKQP